MSDMHGTWGKGINLIDQLKSNYFIRGTRQLLSYVVHHSLS